MGRKPASHQSSARGASQRQLRMGELVRHILAEVLMRGDINDPVLGGVSVTISEVRTSPDLRHAHVFCAPLGGLNTEAVIEALNRRRGYLRGLLGKGLTTKFTPDLIFSADTSYDTASSIDALLRSDAVRRDLDRPETDEDRG